MPSANKLAALTLAASFRALISSCIPQFRFMDEYNIIRIFERKLLPAIPDNYQVALIVFRVLFETFFYAKDPSTAASPPSVHSVFMFIREVKGKLRFLQIVLKEMCKSSCHCFQDGPSRSN